MVMLEKSEETKDIPTDEGCGVGGASIKSETECNETYFFGVWFHLFHFFIVFLFSFFFFCCLLFSSLPKYDKYVILKDS